MVYLRILTVFHWQKSLFKKVFNHLGQFFFLIMPAVSKHFDVEAKRASNWALEGEVSPEGFNEAKDGPEPGLSWLGEWVLLRPA